MRHQLYEAAGRQDGRGLGAGDSQEMPSRATPESPAIPAPADAAGTASRGPPQGGRPAAQLPAGWLSHTHQQPAAIGMQGAESPQLQQLPPWTAPSQQLVSPHDAHILAHPICSERLSHVFSP